MTEAFFRRYALVDEASYDRFLANKDASTTSRATIADPLTDTNPVKRSLVESAKGLRDNAKDRFLDPTQRALAYTQLMRAYASDLENMRDGTGRVAIRPTSSSRPLPSRIPRRATFASRDDLAFDDDDDERSRRDRRPSTNGRSRPVSRSPIAASSPRNLRSRGRVRGGDDGGVKTYAAAPNESLTAELIDQLGQPGRSRLIRSKQKPKAGVKRKGRGSNKQPSGWVSLGGPK